MKSVRPKGWNGEDEKNFEQFWSALRKESRVAKIYARKCWKKEEIVAADMVHIMAGIERLKGSRRWHNGYVPNASTIINQERWDDEAFDAEAAQAQQAQGKCSACGYNKTLHDLKKFWSIERWAREKMPDDVCGEYRP